MKKHEYKVNLIILDMMMPEVLGLEVLKILKNDTKTMHIPVIVQSGLADNMQIEEALIEGAFDYDYMLKPIDKNELVQKIEMVVK